MRRGKKKSRKNRHDRASEEEREGGRREDRMKRDVEGIGR